MEMEGHYIGFSDNSSQDEINQINYIYNLLAQMLPQGLNLDSGSDREMEMILSAIEYIQGLNEQLYDYESSEDSEMSDDFEMSD